MIRSKIYYFLSVPVFIVLYTYTAVVVLLVMLFSFLSWKKAIYGIIQFWAKSVFPIMGKRLHIKGRENFEKGKKYILLANHSSNFDIMGIMAIFPSVSWFGQEYLLRIPLFGRVLKMIDYIPMSIANIRNTRRMVTQLVENSNSKTVAIFPEGTRTINGRLNPFYRGFIYLLRASETDILPVTLNGFFELKPKTRFHINFSARLEVIIHKPINASELLQLEDKEIIDSIREIIESASSYKNIENQ
ncbi:lysophospholipid acyltransferase family protein [Bacteroidota bacterium]